MKVRSSEEEFNYRVPLNVTLSKQSYEAVRRAAKKATIQLSEAGLDVDVAMSAIVESLIRRYLK